MAVRRSCRPCPLCRRRRYRRRDERSAAAAAQRGSGPAVTSRDPNLCRAAMPGPHTVNKSRARRRGMVKTTTAVLATVAAAAILSIAVAPIGYAYAYAAPGGQAAPIGTDGADGAHGGDYDGEGGTCPFKDRQGASVQGAWQVI